MKTCRNCGCINTDDCLFCEKCGQKLEALPKKPKLIWILLPIACVVALIIIAAALLFVFRDKLPIIGKEKAQAEATVSEEVQENTEDGEGELNHSKQEDKMPEAETEEAVDADIDGVNQAYVQVMGKLAEKDGYLVVQMHKPSSVRAYNDENEPVQAKEVEYLLIDREDMEQYEGAEVSIKGKISARNDGTFTLEIVKLDVQKEAAVKEEAERAADADSEQETERGMATGSEQETERGMATGSEQGTDDHHYSLIVADVTWQEAFDDCISRGGYLAQINSEEEYQAIIQMIEEENKQNIHFYLGGRRDIDSREYYWVNRDNELSGEVLNPEGNSWISVHWMENEPSFTSEEDQEMYMNMIFYQDSWVLNDVPMDITVYYPGKTGYICEFED